MTGAQFKAWRTLMKWSMREAAERLGVNRNTVLDYDRHGAPEKIRLACDALAVSHGVVTLNIRFPYYEARP